MRSARFAVSGFLAGVAAWASAPPAAFARADLLDEEMKLRVLIFFVTGITASLLGLLFYHLSQRSSEVRFKKAEDDPALAEAETARKLVALKALERLPIPPESRHEIAQSVADIIATTVSEQVALAKKEANDRYGKLIEEQRRTGTALQRKYEEVLIEKKQTQSVLESIAEGLVVVNNKGEVIMMNPAAEKLLAVNQRDRIGKPLTDDMRDEQLISMVTGVDEAREIVLNTKRDSTKRILRSSNAVITDEDGKTVGMVAVLSDVTKQREIDQMKSEFVSKVSHELRTPIVAMQHALSILVEGVAGPLTEEQQKFTSLTQRNLQRLNTLINDLLDLSKLEAKKMELRPEFIAVGTVIGGVCETLEAWANSKEVTLTRRVAGEVPNVMCDPGRITQVLTNLIGNAIKFTPKQGRVTVESRLAEQGNAVEVSVADTGIGIAKEDLPKLFSKFQQVGERTSSDIGGTGLGLAIAKEIVELHRGRIWAESNPEKRGARFAFILPLDASAGHPPG